MEMSNDVEYLIEMGWSKEYAERALEETKHQGLQIALEWIIDHPPDESASNVDGMQSKGDLDKPQTEETPGPVGPVSYKCESCRKMMLTGEDIKLHSARTGHAKFVEFTGEIKPPTEEEKLTQLLKIREHMRAKKIQRDEEDRLKQLEDEKNRRQQGKTIISAKAKFKDDEMRRNVEQLKLERAQDRAYREKLRAEIARDKQEKLGKQRAEKEGGVSAAVVPLKAVSDDTKPSDKTAADTPATTCRLQIRTPGGPPLVCTFHPEETLAAVVLFVFQNWSCGALDTREITLQSSFPPKTFTETELAMTLESLSTVVSQKFPLCGRRVSKDDVHV